MISDDGRDAVGRFGHTPWPPYRPFGYAVPRAVLDWLLIEAAGRAGARIRTGVALDRLIVEDGTVRGAILREGGSREAVAARITVGADGLNSAVARHLGLARGGRLRRLALVAHLAGVAGTSDVGEMFMAGGWYAGLAAIGGGLVNVAMVVPLSDAPAIHRDREGFFLGRLSAIPELRERLADASIVREILLAGPFARRARRPIANGALLVGDAADFYDPFTGEGIFAALRGAELLTPYALAALASGRLAAGDLAGYVRARLRTFGGKWLIERLIGWAVAVPRVLDHVAARLARRPELADLLVGTTGDFVPAWRVLRPDFAWRLVR
jgi:flavin-dependent dehydrogenase